MFARLAALALLAAAPALASPPAGEDPLTRPMHSSYTDRWMAPRPAIPLLGGTWLTGSLHLNTAVIDTGAGLIVVDAGLPQSVAPLEAQIRSTGHRVSDVRYILVTEAHFDHAGGVAALARDSGAVVVGSPYTIGALAHGRTGPEDQQAADLQAFPAPRRFRTIADGGTLKLGRTTVTAHFTPGHTMGSTSWTWTACDKALGCRAITFMASLSPVAQDGWRFSDPAHARVVAAYRGSFIKAAALPCDILITGHPEHSRSDDKVAAALKAADPHAPQAALFEDKGACRAAAERFSTWLDKNLAQEAAAH